MSTAALVLFWLPLAVAAEPTSWIETPLPMNVAVQVSEADLVAKLSTMGPGTEIVLVTANKAHANALVNLIGAQPGYRYVQAGSASEALKPVQAMGAQCGVFLSKGSAGWKATAVGTCPVGTAGSAPAVAATPAVAPAVTAPAPAAAAPVARPGDALLAQTLAAPDAPARKKLLTDALASGQLDGETAGIAGQALAVVGYLETTNRTDPSIVRMFLTAAFSADAATRGAAVDAARAGGDPPGVAPHAPFLPTVVAAPTAAPDPAALRKYNSGRLVRGSLDLTVGSVYGTHGTMYGSVSTVATWTVRDGAGAPLNTISFADRVGDTTGAARARSQRTTGQVLGIGGIGVGSILYIASLGLLLGNDLDPNRDQQLRTATGLLVAGTVAYIPGIAGVLVWNNALVIPKHYRPEEADGWIEKHNARLRTQLGLTEQDVQSIDTK